MIKKTNAHLCFVVFNREAFNMISSPIVYSALLQSLQTVGFNCETLFEDELEANIEKIKVNDIVLFVDTYLLTLKSKVAHSILTSIKGIKISVGCDDEYLYRSTINFSQYMNKVVTFDTVTHEYLRQLGVDSSICPHALSPTDTQISKNQNYEYDVSFIGRVSGDKPRRYNFLQEIKKEFPNSYFPGLTGEYVTLDEMHSVFQKSKINLNLTGISDFASGQGLPLEILRRGFKGRPFEIGTCGGFCLSEKSPALERILNGSHCIDFFSKTDDCLEKINYYLSREEERIATAANLEDFTKKNILSNQFTNLFGNEILATRKKYSNYSRPATLLEQYGQEISNKIEPEMELNRLVWLFKDKDFASFFSQIFFLYRKNIWQGYYISKRFMFLAIKRLLKR